MSVNTEAIKLYVEYECDTEQATIQDVKEYFNVTYLDLYPLVSDMDIVTLN